MEEPDCYDKEELEIQQNTLEEYFQEYRTYTREPVEDQLEAAMEKVLEWNKEREHLLEGNVPENLWDGSRIGERKKTVISNAERIVLRNMYPPGCRVELEDMEADPYVKLSPGDLGTVQFGDDAGQIHVSWDCDTALLWYLV